MIISIINEKGGVGKTTITFNLAIEYQKTDKDIFLIDADKQKSLTMLNNLRQQNKFKMIDINNIETIKNKIILIDTGGRDNQEMRQSILLSDIVIIIINISQLDIFVIEKMKDLSNEAKKINKKLKIYYLLNRITTNIFLSKEIKEFKELIGTLNINILNSIIHERNSYKKSLQDGIGISEMLNKDNKAIMEMQNLYDEINNIL
jgi:chromosome partitioning protein